VYVCASNPKTDTSPARSSSRVRSLKLTVRWTRHGSITRCFSLISPLPCRFSVVMCIRLRHRDTFNSVSSDNTMSLSHMHTTTLIAILCKPTKGNMKTQNVFFEVFVFTRGDATIALYVSVSYCVCYDLVLYWSGWTYSTVLDMKAFFHPSHTVL